MSTLITTSVDNITVLPQVRKNFDPAAHIEMVESVKQYGILQALLVREDVSTPGRFILIAGERRLRAAKEAKLLEVPCTVAFASPESHSDMQLVENLQRSDLGLEETAAGVDALYRRSGRMIDVCKALSKSMPWVSKMVAVANKLGKYATELLVGGHTQDAELLTVMTRIEEGFPDAWPRIETLVEDVKGKKAGRAEVIALHDALKAEEAENGGDEDDASGSDESTEIAINFTAVDALHDATRAMLLRLAVVWKTGEFAKGEPAKKATYAEAEKEIAQQVAAIAAHWRDLFHNTATECGVEPAAPAAPKRKR